MALLRTPRTAWVEAGLRALSSGGPEAVRVETLAESLGVTKGGFYGQFSDRAELLTEMLDTWASSYTEEVIKEVDSGGGSGREKLRHLFVIAISEVDELLGIELAIRDWARRDAIAAERLRRIDEQRMDYMRSLFAEFCRDDKEVEARSLLAFSLFIGSHFVVAGHGKRTRKEVFELSLDQLLL
jgi:AcrR family transcriptional regulator